MYILLHYSSKIHFLLILLTRILGVNFLRANCESDVGIGYQVTLAIPPAYSTEFVGRAFLMETDQLLDPNFRTALSVEAQPDENYSCSLDIFLGNVKVWSSAHFFRFYAADKCTLELTQFGDLQLKGQKDTIGWRSGTSGQGVQRLQLLSSGNLVLVDAHNLIRWQSFNFPTDIMLWGQRLSSKTRLTSFISNYSTRIFYTLEIQYDKIALFLNYGTWKYSYWEFRPLGEHNITYVELSSDALEIFNGKFQKVAQITSQQQQQQERLRFLALDNATGNLGLYYYSAQENGFRASYQALNITCDLPLACKAYGICTFSQTCSCVSLRTRGAAGAGARSLSGCSSIITGINGGDESGSEEGRLCGSSRAEMVELEGVTSILRGVPSKVKKVSREGCGNLCLDNCSCVAALYSSEDMDGADEGADEAANCFLYGMVRGVKQVERGNAVLRSYMVKVPKGSSEDDAVRGRTSSGLKRWVVVVIGMGDGLVILMVVGGIGCYLIRKRRNNSGLEHTPTPPAPAPAPAPAARNPSHSFQTF